ncbi:MAG: hypothetical protein ACKPA7_33045, partial [Sphaerospermopsis kisseleviana]
MVAKSDQEKILPHNYMPKTKLAEAQEKLKTAANSPQNTPQTVNSPKVPTTTGSFNPSDYLA